MVRRRHQLPGEINPVTAFDLFYEEHLGLVYAVAVARGLEPAYAEDLAQETFLRAWRHFGMLSILPPAARKAWLLSTLRNLVIDAWRRRCVENAEMEARAAVPPDTSDRTALRLDVARALSHLAEEDREMVVLRYFQEMNSREIGEVLGIPEGTVRRRLLECRRKLADLLHQWAPEGVAG